MAQANDLKNIVALSLAKNMGPVGFKRLMERFGDAASALRCATHELKGLTVQGKKSLRLSWEELTDPKLLDRAEQEIEKATRSGVQIIPFGDERYPEALGQIYDPPIVLYVKGKLPQSQGPSVAVVGSRVASLYGKKMALEISRGLASAGVPVISGLALGIDTAAHQGALEAGGVTIAVLGGGIGKLYPSENRKLAERICERGALISEYPVEMAPQPGCFPVRNRIISGLCSAVLVVEAKEKSGALITADLALEQGRDVLAVPGNADSFKSAGTNSLIKQGARLVLSAQDVLLELGFSIEKKAKTPKRAAVTAEEERVLSFLEAGPVHLDQIIEASSLSLQKTLGVLSYLQLKGFVKESPGKYFQKA